MFAGRRTLPTECWRNNFEKLDSLLSAQSGTSSTSGGLPIRQNRQLPKHGMVRGPSPFIVNFFLYFILSLIKLLRRAIVFCIENDKECSPVENAGRET